MSVPESSGRDGDGPRQSAAWVDGDTQAEEVRIGDSRLVKGGAKVSFVTDEPQAPDDLRHGGGRVLSDSEVAESGLLKERVIEIGEMREEAVVSKQAVVREELVVRKDVEERRERVSETLRRTEVDIERIETASEPEDDGEDAESRPGSLSRRAAP